MQIALDVGLLCGTDVRIFVLYEVRQYTFFLFFLYGLCCYLSIKLRVLQISK